MRYVFLLFGVVLGWLIIGIIGSVITSNECFALGYPRSTFTWKFDAYCIRRQGEVVIPPHQTDVAIPLSRAKESAK